MAQAISLADAAVVSNNVLVEGVIADIISEDQFFAHLPFVTFDGLSYTFVREKSLAKANFATVGTNLNALKYQQGATFENVNVNLTSLNGEIIMPAQIHNQFSDTNDQLALQVSSKAKQIARQYMNAIINARRGGALTQSNNGPIGIADRFNGMASILDAESGNVDDINHPFYNAGAPTQTLSLVEDDPASARFGKAGRVYTLEDLDDVLDRVRVGVDFIMMNAREIRTLRVLLRNTGGGTDSYQIQQAGLGNMRPMLMYQDYPVFRNDFISRFDAVNTTSHTVSSVTDSDTVVLSSATASDATQLLLRGSDGVLYRYPILSGAGTATVDVQITGSFTDPEQNELVARVALNTAGLFPVGSAATSAERIDGSSIYCGAWGQQRGVAGFTSSKTAGLTLEYVGPRENEDAYQYRLRWYCGFDLYNRLALARIKDVLPLGS